MDAVEDSPAIVGRVVRLLREAERPLSAREIAGPVLGLVGPVGPGAEILEATLAGDARLRRTDDGLWALAETPREEPGEAAGGADAAAWVHFAGPRPPMDAPIELGWRLRGGGTEAVRCDPGGPVQPDRLRALGLRNLAEARPFAEALARLRSVAGGAVVVWDDAQARALRPAAERVVSLAPSLARNGAIARGDGIDAAAWALGVSWGGELRADRLASVVLTLHDEAEARGLLAPPDPREPAPEVPPWARDLPEGPGVYRFLSDAGAVLYVGKARSLRARVRTYFGGSDGRRRHAELMARAAGVRITETCSEAEALLLEAEAIREESPPYNVQRSTGSRAGRVGDRVLFLPGPAEGVLAVLLVDGRVAARVEIGRGNRGIGRLEEAVRRHVLRGEPVREDAGEGEILKTWLRREGDRVSCLELPAVSTGAAVSRLLRAYLADPDLLRGPVRHVDP
jgi:hypothetical protein